MFATEELQRCIEVALTCITTHTLAESVSLKEARNELEALRLQMLLAREHARRRTA